MKLLFSKYQGTGNDFIILDNRDLQYEGLTKEQVAFLCSRRFGIGADGLMLLNKHPQYDFEMIYFNSDGGKSSMCGNGGRCLVNFAHEKGIIRSDYKFIAIDGLHNAEIEINGDVSLKMNDVNDVKFSGGSYVLNTGSPHYVQVVENVMQLDVYKKGKEIRNSRDYAKDGINVNFVEQTDDGHNIIVRTYERGVENETYSCGTGVTAAAIVCYHNDNGFNSVEVDTKGGHLTVEYDKIGDTYRNIWLSGPAVKVFEGTIEL